jgi:hypothetical protein
MERTAGSLAQSSERNLDWLLVSVAGFATASMTTRLGLNVDATLPFQEALRLNSGQVMYQDFYAPYGPLGAFFILPFFKLFGAGGLAYIVATSAVNAVAATSVWALVRSTGADRMLCALAGLLTACWFSAQFGGVFYDHYAYLAVLLAAVVYVSTWSEPVRGFLLGALIGVALFCKQQTTGPLAVMMLCGSILLTEGLRILRSRLFLFAILGLFAVVAVVLGTIVLTGSWEGYARAVFEYPLEYRNARDKNPFRLLLVWLTPFMIDPVSMMRDRGLGRLSFYPVVLAVYGVYYSVIKHWRSYFADPRRRFVVVYLLSSTLMCGAVIGRSFNELTWGLWGAVVLALGALQVRRVQVAAVGAAYVGLALFFAVWTFKPFSQPLADTAGTALWPIRVVDWNTAAYGSGVKGAVEVEALIAASGEPYAFIDDSVALLPLLVGRAPTNWPVQYVNSQTIPMSEQKRHEWQEILIKQLEDKHTTWIVSGLETTALPLRSLQVHKPGEAWASLPLARAYVDAHYEKQTTHGPVELYKRLEKVHAVRTPH